MKTPIYSMSILLALAMSAAAQAPTTTTSTSISTTTVAAPGPTATVVTDPVPAGTAAPAGAATATTGGAITNPNAAAAPATGRRTMYQVIDANADGLVSRVEFEAYGVAQTNSPSGAAGSGTAVTSGSGSTGNAIAGTTNFPLLDANSDGYLSQQEFARSAYHENSETAAADAVRATGAASVVVSPGATVVTTSTVAPQMFQSVDANRDGYLSLPEFYRYHSALNDGTSTPAGTTAQTGSGSTPQSAISFDQLDSNSDKRLSVEEFARADAKGNLQTTIRVAPLGQ